MKQKKSPPAFSLLIRFELQWLLAIEAARSKIRGSKQSTTERWAGASWATQQQPPEMDDCSIYSIQLAYVTIHILENWYTKQVVVKVRTLTLVRGIFATWKRNCLVFFLDKKENETKVTRLISLSSWPWSSDRERKWRLREEGTFNDARDS
jgi:hypothetical protein